MQGKNPPHGLRPSTVERANEGANALFGTVDALFGTADSGGTKNEEGKEHFAPPDAPAAVDSLSRILLKGLPDLLILLLLSNVSPL